jgi:hypothetical protein
MALTPKQVEDLVNHFDGLGPAAQAVGVPRSTLWGWLHPEEKREHDRRGVNGTASGSGRGISTTTTAPWEVE